MRGGNFVEGEDFVDHRPNDVTQQQGNYLRGKGARRGDLLLDGTRAQHRSAQRQSLAEHDAYRDGRVATGHRADEDDSSLGSSGGNACRDVRPADEIEHDLDARAARSGHHVTRDVVRRVADDYSLFQTERASPVQLIRGTRVAE